MAESEEQPPPTLFHEVRSNQVVSQNDGESTQRIARFLKPTATHVEKAVKIPNTPLLFEIFPHSLQNWPSKVIFKGWNSFQHKWKQWVESLAPKYGSIWLQAGILDAIMSSIYEVRFNPDLVTGLVEFWCPDTNTFVFPWGEATMTLEDVMVLGGFPVVGEEIAFPLCEELVGIERELIKRRTEMCRSRAKKAHHSTWLKHFMEEERGSEFEHVGFLSLWLSRYVFPSLAVKTIGTHVFPTAIALSRGKPISLAPAVLASLYRDMRLLTEKGMDFEESICVSAPFQLLQLWAFEHFPLLGPISPNSLSPGEPRVARWNRLSLKINLPLVRSALQLAENFCWRPYAANVENWRFPSYSKETEQLLVDGSNLDGELRSFFKCLVASELVGIECREKYLPHRVAMQFGFDQDLPADISDVNFSGENARFFVPPRSFQPVVSGRHMKWWKEMMINREVAIKDVLVHKRNEMKCKLASLSLKQNGNVEGFHGSSASKSPTSPKKLSQASTKNRSEGRPSKMQSSVEAKKSKGVRHDSSSSKSSNEEVKRLSDSSDDDLPSVSVKPEIKSEMPPSVEAKKCKVVSIASSIREGIGKPSQVSTKSNIKQTHDSNSPNISSRKKQLIYSDSSDDDNLPIATCINKSSEQRRPSAVTPRASVSAYPPPMKSKLSSSVNISNASVAPTSGGKPSQVPTKLNSKLNHELGVHDIPFGVKEKIPSDSSKEDTLPIATRPNCCSAAKITGQDFSCNQSQNVVSSTSTIAKEKDRKRKLSLQEEVSKKPANGVKTEGCSFNGPIDIFDELNDEIKPSKKCRESVKGVADGSKRTKAGESMGNPIDIDDCMEIATRGSQKCGKDYLESRVEKLEKLLGVIPD